MEFINTNNTMECRHKYVMCRLCLCVSDRFFDIFRVNELSSYVAAEVIKDLLNIQVSQTDGYPHVVCSCCLGRLTDFKKFKEKCKDSRSIYHDVFHPKESLAETEEVRPVKYKAIYLLDTEETQQKVDLDSANFEEEETTTDVIPPQIRKCGIAFTPLDNLMLYQKKPSCESHGPHENITSNANDGGKPLLKGREKIAVDGNIKSPGSAKVKVEKINIDVHSDNKSPYEIRVLPLEKGDISRLESNFGELNRVRINKSDDVIRINVDDTGGREPPLIGNEHYRSADCGKDFEEKELPKKHGDRVCSNGEDFEVDADVNWGSEGDTNKAHKERKASDEVKKDKVKSHLCEKCGKSFSRINSLRKHIETHDRKEGWRRNLSKEGERKYGCGTCGKLFKSLASVKWHLKIHSGVKPYVCAVCDKAFISKHSLKSHSYTHTNERPFECDVCAKRFKTEPHLVMHALIHTKVKPYICDVCGKGFTQRAYMTVHMRIHSGERPYVCEVCGMAFTRREVLVMHSRCHTGEKPFQCEVCGKNFNQRSSLYKHSRTHSGERPHVCEVCGKTFKGGNVLKKHLTTHTEERPYPCEICGKHFRDTSSLRKHLMVHTGRRPFACQVCKKGFRDSCQLRTHFRTHTGERPYACTACDKRFSDVSTLRRHLRVHLR